MKSKHHEVSEQYCRDVLDGTVIAGRWIKLACKRHLDDLAKQDDPEYPYKFSPKKANRICRFAELLPHVKGVWARKRERITLQPWQTFILCAIFGWLRKADNLRRFRTALVYVPRKNGKSLLAAVIGLYMLVADGEAGAEVLCGATSLEQAGYVFRPAQQIVEKTLGLRQLGIQVLANALVVPETGSKMVSIIGQPPDGSNPSCAIADEAHEHVNDILISTMVSGMGSRDQPLLLVTTTSGYNTASPAKFMQDDLQDVLNGLKDNDELFGVVFPPDENVDWKSELALRQANPNMCVSVREDYLFQQQREAIQSPRKQTPFKTKHLDLWTSTSSSWLPLEKWNACADPTLKLDDFKGETCWAGLDLANKLDLTAYVLCFRKDDHYFLFPRFYLPETQVEDPGNTHYKQWHELGYLEATPGNINSYRELKEDILEDSKRFDLCEVGHDPAAGAYTLMADLSDEKITCTEIDQRWRGMSDPMKTLEAYVIAKKISHDGNPCMAWCVANTKAKLDRLENVVPDKESPEKKIDGTVAAIMALRGAYTAPVKPKRTAGFLFVA